MFKFKAIYYVSLIAGIEGKQTSIFGDMCNGYFVFGLLHFENIIYLVTTIIFFVLWYLVYMFNYLFWSIWYICLVLHNFVWIYILNQVMIFWRMWNKKPIFKWSMVVGTYSKTSFSTVRKLLKYISIPPSSTVNQHWKKTSFNG